MILGIGTDLCDGRRIKESLDKMGDKFKNRLFTASEQKKCDQRVEPWMSYAKIFAAKEATLKAIGNTNNITWHDMEILSHKNGKPYVKVSNAALGNIERQLKMGQSFQIDVSLTDEVPYAQAFVVISIK